MDKKKCPVLVDGKECGLELTEEETEEGKLLGLHRCPFGHRAYIGAAKETFDPSSSTSHLFLDQSKK